MAIIYCRNDGSNGDGLTWANAKTTLAAAVTAAGNDGTVYVGDGHTESSATAITITGGTAALPVTVLSVNDTGNPEPPTALAAGGTITIAGGNVALNINGFLYFHGLNFVNANNGNNSHIQIQQASGSGAIVFDNCRLALTGTHISQRMHFGYTFGIAADDQWIELIDTDLEFSNTSQQVLLTTSRVLWRGSASQILGASLPTTLFIPTAGLSPQLRISGVDLSALGAGKNLFGMNIQCSALFEMENCKPGSGFSLTTGTIPGPGGSLARMVNCDSADTNGRYQLSQFSGTITNENTIVRTGGAAFNSVAYSRKMASNADAEFIWPLYSDWIAINNTSTGSAKTVTVECITDNVTLTDGEAWLEVQYQGTSGFPLALFGSDRKANILATAANQETSSVAWTTTGLTTPVKQKFSVSVTPQEQGLILARVALAKPSTTMYFCPKVTVV